MKLKKGPTPLPVVTASKDAASKGKNKKEVFNTTQGMKQVLNIQTTTNKASTPNQAPKGSK